MHFPLGERQVHTHVEHEAKVKIRTFHVKALNGKGEKKNILDLTAEKFFLISYTPYFSRERNFISLCPS